MIAFCHIPKTAGMAVNYVLKSSLGMRFVAATTWGQGIPITNARDLRLDLLPYPWARAVAGHGIRPFLDYGTWNERLMWVTLLREPVARAVSHYAYNREVRDLDLEFAAWLRQDRGNYQVRWIAGEEDLEAAKQILDERFALVGLQEHFREFLVLLKHQVFGGRLHIANERRINATKSGDLKAAILDRLDDYRDLLDEKYGLDTRLYEHVKRNVWPRQVEALGAETLREQVEFEFGSTSDRGAAQRVVHDLYRSAVYKPLVLVTRTLGLRG